MVEVLERDFDWSKERTVQARALLSSLFQHVTPHVEFNAVKRDPDHNSLIECSPASRSDCLVISNKNLCTDRQVSSLLNLYAGSQRLISYSSGSRGLLFLLTPHFLQQESFKQPWVGTKASHSQEGEGMAKIDQVLTRCCCQYPQRTGDYQATLFCHRASVTLINQNQVSSHLESQRESIPFPSVQIC